MMSRDPDSALFAGAIELLRQADRMHRQFFGLGPMRISGPSWEPPVDIIERDNLLIIRVALPGATQDSIEAVSDGSALRVTAVRQLDIGPGDAIHRIEIPYGRFERRIQLPAGHYEMTRREFADGCLVLALQRLS